jgi:hypothetical protein
LRMVPRLEAGDGEAGGLAWWKASRVRYTLADPRTEQVGTCREGV